MIQEKMVSIHEISDSSKTFGPERESHTGKAARRLVADERGHAVRGTLLPTMEEKADKEILKRSELEERQTKDIWREVSEGLEKPFDKSYVGPEPDSAAKVYEEQMDIFRDERLMDMVADARWEGEAVGIVVRDKSSSVYEPKAFSDDGSKNVDVELEAMEEDVGRSVKSETDKSEIDSVTCVSGIVCMDDGYVSPKFVTSDDRIFFPARTPLFPSNESGVTLESRVDERVRGICSEEKGDQVEHNGGDELIKDTFGEDSRPMASFEARLLETGFVMAKAVSEDFDQMEPFLPVKQIVDKPASIADVCEPITEEGTEKEDGRVPLVMKETRVDSDGTCLGDAVSPETEEIEKTVLSESRVVDEGEMKDRKIQLSSKTQADKMGQISSEETDIQLEKFEVFDSARKVLTAATVTEDETDQEIVAEGVDIAGAVTSKSPAKETITLTDGLLVEESTGRILAEPLKFAGDENFGRPITDHVAEEQIGERGASETSRAPEKVSGAMDAEKLYFEENENEAEENMCEAKIIGPLTRGTESKIHTFEEYAVLVSPLESTAELKSEEPVLEAEKDVSVSEYSAGSFKEIDVERYETTESSGEGLQSKLRIADETHFLTEPKIIKKEMVEAAVEPHLFGGDELAVTVGTSEPPSVSCPGESESVTEEALRGHAFGELQPTHTEKAGEYVVHDSWIAELVPEEQKMVVDSVSKCRESEIDVLMSEIPALELASTISQAREFVSDEDIVGKFVSREDLMDTFEIGDSRVTEHFVNDEGRGVVERNTAEDGVTITHQIPDTKIDDIFPDDASQILLQNERDYYVQKDEGFEIKDNLMKFDTFVKEIISERIEDVTVRIEEAGDDVITSTKEGKGVGGEMHTGGDISEFSTVKFETEVVMAVAEEERDSEIVEGKFLIEEKGLSKAERTQPQLKQSEQSHPTPFEQEATQVMKTDEFEAVEKLIPTVSITETKLIVCVESESVLAGDEHSGTGNGKDEGKTTVSDTHPYAFYPKNNFEKANVIMEEAEITGKMGIKLPLQVSMSDVATKDDATLSTKNFVSEKESGRSKYIGGEIVEDELVAKAEFTVSLPSEFDGSNENVEKFSFNQEMLPSASSAGNLLSKEFAIYDTFLRKKNLLETAVETGGSQGLGINVDKQRTVHDVTEFVVEDGEHLYEEEDVACLVSSSKSVNEKESEIIPQVLNQETRIRDVHETQEREDFGELHLSYGTSADTQSDNALHDIRGQVVQVDSANMFSLEGQVLAIVEGVKTGGDVSGETGDLINILEGTSEELNAQFSIDIAEEKFSIERTVIPIQSTLDTSTGRDHPGIEGVDFHAAAFEKPVPLVQQKEFDFEKSGEELHEKELMNPLTRETVIEGRVVEEETRKYSSVEDTHLDPVDNYVTEENKDIPVEDKVERRCKLHSVHTSDVPEREAEGFEVGLVVVEEPLSLTEPQEVTEAFAVEKDVTDSVCAVEMSVNKLLGQPIGEEYAIVVSSQSDSVEAVRLDTVGEGIGSKAGIISETEIPVCSSKREIHSDVVLRKFPVASNESPPKVCDIGLGKGIPVEKGDVFVVDAISNNQEPKTHIIPERSSCDLTVVAMAQQFVIAEEGAQESTLESLVIREVYVDGKTTEVMGESMENISLINQEFGVIVELTDKMPKEDRGVLELSSSEIDEAEGDISAVQEDITHVTEKEVLPELSEDTKHHTIIEDWVVGKILAVPAVQREDDVVVDEATNALVGSSITVAKSVILESPKEKLEPDRETEESTKSLVAQAVRTVGSESKDIPPCAESIISKSEIMKHAVDLTDIKGENAIKIAHTLFVGDEPSERGGRDAVSGEKTEVPLDEYVILGQTEKGEYVCDVCETIERESEVESSVELESDSIVEAAGILTDVTNAVMFDREIIEKTAVIDLPARMSITEVPDLTCPANKTSSLSENPERTFSLVDEVDAGKEILLHPSKENEVRIKSHAAECLLTQPVEEKVTNEEVASAVSVIGSEEDALKNNCDVLQAGPQSVETQIDGSIFPYPASDLLHVVTDFSGFSMIKGGVMLEDTAGSLTCAKQSRKEDSQTLTSVVIIDEDSKKEVEIFSDDIVVKELLTQELDGTQSTSVEVEVDKLTHTSLGESVVHVETLEYCDLERVVATTDSTAKQEISQTVQSERIDACVMEKHILFCPVNEAIDEFKDGLMSENTEGHVSVEERQFSGELQTRTIESEYYKVLPQLKGPTEVGAEIKKSCLAEGGLLETEDNVNLPMTLNEKRVIATEMPTVIKALAEETEPEMKSDLYETEKSPVDEEQCELQVDQVIFGEHFNVSAETGVALEYREISVGAYETTTGIRSAYVSAHDTGPGSVTGPEKFDTDIENVVQTERRHGDVVEVVSLEDTVVLSTYTASKAFQPESVTCIFENPFIEELLDVRSKQIEVEEEATTDDKTDKFVCREQCMEEKTPKIDNDMDEGGLLVEGNDIRVREILRNRNVVAKMLVEKAGTERDQNKIPLAAETFNIDRKTRITETITKDVCETVESENEVRREQTPTQTSHAKEAHGECSHEIMVEVSDEEVSPLYPSFDKEKFLQTNFSIIEPELAADVECFATKLPLATDFPSEIHVNDTQEYVSNANVDNFPAKSIDPNITKTDDKTAEDSEIIEVPIMLESRTQFVDGMKLSREDVLEQNVGVSESRDGTEIEKQELVIDLVHADLPLPVTDSVDIRVDVTDSVTLGEEVDVKEITTVSEGSDINEATAKELDTLECMWPTVKLLEIKEISEGEEDECEACGGVSETSALDGREDLIDVVDNGADTVPTQDVPLDQDGIFQEKRATKVCVGKESICDISTKPYDHVSERKLSEGENVVLDQEHVLKTEIPYFLSNEFEMETGAVAMVGVRKLSGEEEALLDKDTVNGILTDVTSVLKEGLLQSDMKGELGSEDCLMGHREQHQPDIFGKGFQEHSLGQIDVAEMSVFGESGGMEFRKFGSEVGGYCMIYGEASVSEEVVECDIGEEVCEVSVIGRITQETEAEINRTEGKVTKLLLVGQEYCDIETMAGVKDVSVVLSQQDLMTEKRKVETEVEITECADAEACIGLSASSASKSDSSLVTTGHQVRLPRETQSVPDHLSASYLVREEPHYFVPCRNEEKEEILSKPEVQKTITGLESQFVEEPSREDFDDAKIGDSVEETASSKSESRIFDDTQTNLPSDAVVPFLSSSNISQFSKICDTSDGKGRVTRKQRLVIDTVAETEVKELICEVREVTRQIKQEVREMKPDLTPTPEGKEVSILPISESREFVELTDLGCIKEEQTVHDLGDEIIKHPVPFCAIDASSGAASSATLSGTETEGAGSFPRSRDDLLQAKANMPTVDSEDSDTLPGPSNTGPIGWMSQELQKTLSASVCRLTGRNINNALDATDTTVETPARGMPGQDREADFMPDTSIIEEQVRTVLDTFTELSELKSSETPDVKEGILDKSSGSLIENVTPSEVVLDFAAPALPVGIVATYVSAEVSDKLSEPIYEIERGCHRDDAPALMPDVEKHIMEESVPEITSPCDEGLFVQDAGPSAVAETEGIVIELIAERRLQETEQLFQDPDPSAAVEGKYIPPAPFEDQRGLLEMELSAAVEAVTPVISDVILEDGISVSEKFESSVEIVPAYFIEASQPASRLQSGVSCLQEQYLHSTREKVEIPTETSNWEMHSNSGFQVSQDDIVMEDDLLEVTVTTEKSSNFGSEGKLFTTESGTTYFEFETGTTRSICVCEKVISSQPVTLHAPGPSGSHHVEKVSQDTAQDESSIRKRSITSKKKTKRSEKQVQSDSTSLKSKRDPKPIATMKKLDDHVTAFRSPKEPDKYSQVTQIPSDGTVHRYRGYMASTLSRDLKVERTVAERTPYFSRDSPVKRRVVTEREDASSTTSPSKLSAGAVHKPPQTVTKSKRVENTSASFEKNVQETSKHAYVSKHTKSTTSAVTTRSVVATEEKLVASLTHATSSINTAAHQKRPVSRDLPSSSSVRQARLSPTFKKSLPESDVSQERGGKIKRSEQTKVCGAVKEQRKAPAVCGKGRKLTEAVPDTTLKVKVKRHAPKLESRIETDSENLLKTMDLTEVTKTDGTAVTPVSSRASILAPAEQDMTTTHSHVTDLKDTAIALTFSPLSHVPSPDSSPSIKSILDKWSAVASERRSSRAPSPSPSASPVRAATSASRSTERVDFSTHTPSSLPSSPSRMLRQTTSQSGVTQILTSEVFTRTVDTSGSIEVIYRQPTSSEAVRRVAVVGGSRSSLHETVPGYGGTGTEGEVSLIDTTDSSLSDSVALPSSSSDHELNMEMRPRTGVSPASPKPTSRSLDLIHDVTGPKLPTSDLMLDYFAVPFVADSEQLAPDSSVLRLEGSSATVLLDAVPKTRTCTQVSEERLSPILDVCAVTPPRVKHKFQYEEDEEGEEDEAVAAFLSSPGNTDDLPSAPTFHSSLAAAASVQSMASELDLRFCEVHMNVGSDSHWDSESGKPSLDNILSKTVYSKHFVNCERFEGKFGTGCNRYGEVYGVEFNVPKSQVFPYSSEGKSGILSDLQLAAMYVPVQSDPQIIRDQFSATGSSVEDSIPIKEVICKQEPQTRGVAKFNLATDLSVNLLNEDEDILDVGEEDIHTLSTSGSEVDYAVVESCSNPLAMIEEEAAEATDEDQDVIPVDDIPVKMGNLDPGEINRHYHITSQSDCMNEQPPVFLNSVNNMAFNHDNLPLLAVMPDDGSNSDVLIKRPYKSVPMVSVGDGYGHLECSEMCDGDYGDILSCPETSTPFCNMSHIPDTTAGLADFKESSKSSLMLCKDFADPGTRFLSGCRTETWSPSGIKESITSTDKNIHFSESCKHGTTKSLDDFMCDRKVTQIKDKLFSSCKSLLDVNHFSKKGGLLSDIPSASKMGRKHSQHPPPSFPSPSNKPNVVYLSDSDEEEQNKQRHPCIVALGGRHSRVSATTTVEIHQLFGNEGAMYNFATGKDLPDFVDYKSSASLVSHESHEGQGIFHSELDGFFSVDGSKSSHPPPINTPQNKFILGIDVPEICLNFQTDTEYVEVTEDIRNSREQSTDGAKSINMSPLKEVQYFCGTVCMVHESKPEEVNCEPCYMTRKTYSGMVELESDCTDKAPNIRDKDLPLQKTPISEDNTAEGNVEDSDMVLRCYTNSSESKTETSETEFMDVNDEACLVVVPSGKILSMNTASISDKNFDTCVQDMQVSERKTSLFTHDNDGRTVADFEGFKIDIHEKTPKLCCDMSSVRDDFHKSLVHISVLQLDTGSHTLPYEDGSGLCATDTDLSTGSEIQTESDNRQTYPELTIIDGDTIETSSITRDLRKYEYAFKVCSSPGPDTNTEDLYFHGAVCDSHGKSKEDLRLISVKGGKPLIKDVKNLQVSESHYSTKHMPAPIFASRKHDDANTGSEYVGMSEEDTSVTRNFVRHMDYNAVASMKETDDGPFLADMLQVLPRTSLAASVIKVTLSSSDMYSGIETEIVDVESADGGALLGSSCIETSTPVEMGLGIESHNRSTTHMKNTHGSDMCAPQNMDHVQGCGNICKVVTDVEEFGLTEKELPQDQPDDNIHVIDAEDQVCVCVSSEKETQNTVCVCVGKYHGQLSMEWRTSSGSPASKTSSWNATQGHEGMICILDLSSAAASLPLSCIRADLPSMQVAVPYYNVESVGSNPLA